MPHTAGRDCLDCTPGRKSDCVHRRYGRKIVRFVKAHLEVYESAYLNGDGRAASGEMKRLEAELRLMPPRHVCTCPQRNRRTGIMEHHCLECAKVDKAIMAHDYPTEIGRSQAVNAPMPLTIMLDYFSGYAA